ncbi:MAG: FG-GAP repeat protein [Pyrinomonadaceae bacterium]
MRKFNLAGFFIVCLVSISSAQTVNLQLQSDYTNDGAAYAPSLAVGDVNNDGRPDLAATNRPTSVGDYI